MTGFFDFSCSLLFWTSRHIKFLLVPYTWNISFNGGVIIWLFCLSWLGYTYFTLFAPSCGRILNFLWLLLFLQLSRLGTGNLIFSLFQNVAGPMALHTNAHTGSWLQNGRGCGFSTRGAELTCGPGREILHVRSSQRLGVNFLLQPLNACWTILCYFPRLPHATRKMKGTLSRAIGMLTSLPVVSFAVQMFFSSMHPSCWLLLLFHVINYSVLILCGCTI